MKAKGYYSAYNRGPEGDEASPETIAHNISLAVQTATTIQMTFPGTLDVWIPHNQRMINMAWVKGLVDSPDILELCCEIIREDLPILLVHNREQHLTEGMKLEIIVGVECGCLVVQFAEWDDEAKEATAVAIQEWMVRHGTLPQERDAAGPLA